jgi:hypothetical protein
VTVAAPAGHAPAGDRHTWVERAGDAAGYTASGLPARSMGRDDELFFAASLSAGAQLAAMIGDG